MKLSLRILFINFLIVVIILGSSFFVFYNIVYDVLTSLQTRNLRQSANNFVYVYRTLQSETEDDFASLYNQGMDNLWKEQKLQLKNIDFILQLEKNDVVSKHISKEDIILPENTFNLREFQSYNPYLMLIKFSTPSGINYAYGRAISNELLNDISQRINSDIALIWNEYPADFSNQQTNQKNLYVLGQAVDDLKNKNNFELYIQGTESQDILATIYSPSSPGGENDLYYLIFSTFAEAGELRSTLQGIFIIIGFVGIALSLIFTMVFTDKFRKQVTELSKATEQTYSGKFDYKIEVKSKDEIGKLGMAFNKMLEELKKKEIAKNEYAEFITLINQNPSLKEISDVALKKIIDAGDFLIGGLYNIDEDTTLISSYGLSPEHSMRAGTSEFFEKVIETKESLELYNEEELPIVSTGLLDIKIKYLLYLPIVYNNKPVAVLELGSLAKPREEVRDYLEKIKDQLAIGITNARALLQLEKLVVELKQLNEEYQKQNVQIKEQNETLTQLHSELKLQAEELEKQKQKAVELTEAKSKFLASMSHELRTPMNSILGLTELMLEKVDLDSRNKERLEVVQNSGKRLMSLINDILDLSKIEAGKVDVLYEDVVLEEIISEVSAAISMLANEKKINYEIVRDVDTHTVINTDRGKVVQVLINLLGNAVKYTDSGSVTLKTFVENDKLNFGIVDTGIGIPAKEIDVIFEEFRQSNSSNSQRRGGTGLGLAISKKIADILGGDLFVRSKLNEGSTFTFSIPFTMIKSFKDEKNKKVVETIPVTEKVKFNLKPETVLSEPKEIKSDNVENSELDIMIVDDDHNTLFTLAEIVQSVNCNSIIAHNGKECLELLETKTPDLILLDIIMPEMDGFKTINQIKRNKKWSDIPVFAVTAKAMKKDNEIILKHGFTDFIPKPVNAAFVSQKIQTLISQLKTT